MTVHFFELELFMHPAFEEATEPAQIPNKKGCPLLVNERLISIVNIIKPIVSVVSERIKENTENQAWSQLSTRGRDQAKANMGAGSAKNGYVVGDQAGDIAGAGDIASEVLKIVDQKTEAILLFCGNPQQRKAILQEIGLSSKAKNYAAYVLPLLKLD